MGLIVGLGALHLVLNRCLGVGSTAALWCTDLGVMGASSFAFASTLVTARRQRERDDRRAWLAISIGAGAWCIGAIGWSIRELFLADVAPAPTFADAPFYLLAPAFAAALWFFRRGRGSRPLQLRQVADLGILTAVVVMAGTLVLAPSLRMSDDNAYLPVAIGYPAFHLAMVLVAVGSLARGAWGPRRIVLAILIWANLTFAAVDLMYGSKVLVRVFQTGIEDTLWIVGFVSLAWAAAEERAIVARSPAPRESSGRSSWNALVGAVALIAIAALCSEALLRLEGVEWTIVAVAAVVLGMFTGLRMWTGERAEAAYLDAVAVGEEKERALTVERTRASRLRAVSSLAGGTAHELNNLLQAIAGSLALLRRRAGRGEDVSAYVHTIEKALARLGDEVDDLRKLSPSDSPQGMILLLPGGDRDGKLAAVLAEAGFAPASLPDVDAAQRAAKGPGVRALVASHEEAAQLAGLGFTLPIIRRDSENVLDAVVAVVELVSEHPDA